MKVLEARSNNIGVPRRISIGELSECNPKPGAPSYLEVGWTVHSSKSFYANSLLIFARY